MFDKLFNFMYIYVCKHDVYMIIYDHINDKLINGDKYMFQIERQEKIRRYINEMSEANTAQLAEHFDVSKVTIRRDIDDLATKGLIVKTHGGALSINAIHFDDIPYVDKFETNPHAKKHIGRLAAELIDNNDIIILDSGTTTFEVAKGITADNVTVLTNDIKISMELASHPNTKVIVSGGVLSGPVYSLTSNQTVNFFKQIHVTKTFIGCDAFDIDFGISNRTYEEVDIKTAMINASDDVIMVTDSSKLRKKAGYHLCDISKVNRIVIDKIDNAYKKTLVERGIEVITAD